MKKINNNRIIALLLTSFSAISIISCTKKYEASEYAPPFTVNGYSYVREIARDNLVAYWAFENSIYDSVGRVDGQAVNSTYEEGLIGQAYKGGPGSYAVSAITDEVKALNNYTISFWMKYPSEGANDGSGVTILSIDGSNYDAGNAIQTGSFDFYKNPWGIDPTNSSASYFGAHVRNINGVTNYWDKTAYLNNLWTRGVFDNWVQWTFTYNSATTTFNIYLNGLQWKSDGFVDGGGSNTYPLNNPSMGTIKFDDPKNIIFGANSILGARGGVSSYPGYLDEVRIYNTALTAAQVQALTALQIKKRP